jgi:hypothetical protein
MPPSSKLELGRRLTLVAVVVVKTVLQVVASASDMEVVDTVAKGAGELADEELRTSDKDEEMSDEVDKLLMKVEASVKVDETSVDVEALIEAEALVEVETSMKEETPVEIPAEAGTSDVEVLFNNDNPVEAGVSVEMVALLMLTAEYAEEANTVCVCVMIEAHPSSPFVWLSFSASVKEAKATRDPNLA